MHRLRISERFGLEKVLHQGSRSSECTFLASDRARNNSLAVIKTYKLPEFFFRDPRKLLFAADQFLSLSHPGLIQPLDVFFDRGGQSLQVVFEYYSGEPFLSTLKSLSTVHFLDILSQICRALQYLHSRNRAHLDLHPGNILLLPVMSSPDKWTVKLLDLPFLPIPDLRKERDIIRFNTYYSAPELLVGNAFDHRADLYSVGVLLHAVLIGEPATRVDPATGLGLGAELVNDDYTSFITPEFLGPIVKKLLQPSPEKRFGSSY
ncbi:MAG: protein kinase, partial [Acidobacteria bacterium]|nr:protein kinase [Acidobacteriota bacterium]